MLCRVIGEVTGRKEQGEFWGCKKLLSKHSSCVYYCSCSSSESSESWDGGVQLFALKDNMQIDYIKQTRYSKHTKVKTFHKTLLAVQTRQIRPSAILYWKLWRC